MRIKEAVIVEGAYDKIKLMQIIDAAVIKVDGFDIFNNKESMEYIKILAKKRGIVILTDSDSAGFNIRSYIKGFVEEGTVLNAYIPEMPGKEKRKRKSSKEGLLGVEGMRDEIIINALKAAGCTINGAAHKNEPQITRQNLYEDGLLGGADAKARRVLLAKELGLPPRLSSTALLEAVNMLFSYEEYKIKVAKGKDA